jgi:hypothetical protein
MLKKYYRLHKKTNQSNDYNEQFCEIEEYLFRKCEERKINWRTLSWTEKLKMAEEFGCKREYTDAMYMNKFAI